MRLAPDRLAKKLSPSKSGSSLQSEDMNIQRKKGPSSAPFMKPIRVTGGAQVSYQDGGYFSSLGLRRNPLGIDFDRIFFR